MRTKGWMLLWAATLVLAACGGGGSAAPVSTSAPATQPPEPAVMATGAPTMAPAIENTPAAAQAPAATEAVSATEAAAAEAPATAAAAALGSETVYKIVPGESTVSYEVGETFFEGNRFATAIGVTPQVSGEITLDPANPQAARIGAITIDISQLTSDSGRRDNTIRERFLVSSQFPIAVFKATKIEGLPAAYTEGQDVTFKVTGDLTVRETTLPVTFDVTARLQGGALTGAATGMIKMSDFGVGPISMAMLRTEDDVKLMFNFVARP